MRPLRSSRFAPSPPDDAANSSSHRLLRLSVTPTGRNGLQNLSRLMVDKITTVPKSKLGEQIGHLDHEDLVRLDRAIMVFLGLA